MREAMPWLAVLAGAIAGGRLGGLVATWGGLPRAGSVAVFGSIGVFATYCVMNRMRGRFVREAAAMALVAGSVLYLMERFVLPMLLRRPA